MKIAIQLWSLSEETQKDFVGTLEKVARMGYDGVEFAGYGGLTAEEMKTHLERLGLEAASSHVGMELLRNDLENQIAYMKTLGAKYIACPGAEMETPEELERTIEDLNRIGAKVKAAGMQLAYHNHIHEFTKFGGKYALDILYESVPEEYLATELDAYWVMHAGLDPVEYVKSYQGRIPLLHIKDLNTCDTDRERYSVNFGEGVLPIRELLDVAKTGKTDWIIVEQEAFKTTPPLESAEIDIAFLKALEK